MIIAVRGTLACYHHVVVVWKEVVFDYESKYTYRLTKESLTQICGKNTTFHGISCGYGIWPPRKIKKNCLKMLTLMIGDIQSGVPKTVGFGNISFESE